MLNCRQVTELACARLDGELSALRRVQIHMHLMICSHCRRFQRQFKQSQEVASALAAKLWVAEEDAIAQVINSLQTQQKPSESKPGPSQAPPEDRS
ncbi:zf-HC2 domain-containing protein [Spongiibacter sp. KMU-158]|uniref:Zf-HC2 domain-containing protein n=1 Tax=Spongiibacter pelagi TaxID=2760804 RepID=A0A927GVG0_9GAMM|nr:zf-HC2 domain-containing protein [Spongiibacter pelagi]MBD2858033.1 zf-HC2 domain-containing protein [Spongiibacter pelagi]